MLSLKSSITKQQSIFTKPKQQSKAATVASIKVAHLLAKKKKPFIDAEITQEAMLVAADSLFDDFKNKTEILGAIKMLQLSVRTATRRIELIASNLEAKLANNVETCEFYSIQLDESIDAVDTAQLAISVKMVFDDFSTKEEFLKILPLTARTQGKDIFSLFKKFAIENKLPLKKLSSITTDGARTMTGSFVMQEKGGKRLVPGPDCMVDALKFPNQTPRISGESLQMCVSWCVPDGTQHLFCLLILTVSGQSLASSDPVVDRRDLNLVFGHTEATHNKLFLSSPTKYTVEPFWLLYIVQLLGDATTTNMPVNFDYFCDFIEIFDDGPACASLRSARVVSGKGREVGDHIDQRPGVLTENWGGNEPKRLSPACCSKLRLMTGVHSSHLP
ncbi:general transcription factor II-I repeat domain-containing protein 2 [Trichonephila clavipes]|nr:general transcription factor II-I repeat domain-containing protein 2 [Trichonephila clavipes]